MTGLVKVLSEVPPDLKIQYQVTDVTPPLPPIPVPLAGPWLFS